MQKEGDIEDFERGLLRSQLFSEHDQEDYHGGLQSISDGKDSQQKVSFIFELGLLDDKHDKNIGKDDHDG